MVNGWRETVNVRFLHLFILLLNKHTDDTDSYRFSQILFFIVQTMCASEDACF
jgi:hypothetical protein